jgi:hypothetical protein
MQILPENLTQNLPENLPGNLPENLPGNLPGNLASLLTLKQLEIVRYYRQRLLLT